MRLLIAAVAVALAAAGCAAQKASAPEPSPARENLGLEKPAEIGPGALGVVRIEGLEHGTYAITLLFPDVKGMQEGATIDVKGRLLLFDRVGTLALLKPPPTAILHRFCQNTWRAELSMVVEAAQVARGMQPVADLQQIGAFVRVVQEGATEAPVSSGAVFAPNRAALTGDVNGDGVPEAWITSVPAPQSCAANSAVSMTLEIPGERWPLTCCEP